MMQKLAMKAVRFGVSQRRTRFQSGRPSRREGRMGGGGGSAVRYFSTDRGSLPESVLAIHSFRRLPAAFFARLEAGITPSSKLQAPASAFPSSPPLRRRLLHLLARSVGGPLPRPVRAALLDHR